MQRRKRIDPRVIGSFVVGAIMLSVAGLVFFGPGGLMSETKLYVLHFDSSVKGLTVGSPVLFRGVKIGQVKDINIRLRPSNYEFHIPVIIEIDPARIKPEGSELGLFEALKTSVKGDNPLNQLVEKGLRAQLKLDSLVTGRLYVNFDMHPAAPAYFSQYPSEHQALPTIPSSLGELTKTIEDLPLRELADKLILSADGFERLVNSPSLHSGLNKFDDITNNLDSLLKNLNSQLAVLSSEMQTTLQTTQATLTKLDRQFEPLSAEFSAAMQAFTAASEQTGTAMQNLQQLTANDSALQQQLHLTLQELNRAARSIRYLSSELERDPQILLRGRKTGGQP